MTKLIVGGVTLAALGYSLKKYIEREEALEKGKSSTAKTFECAEVSDNFKLLYDTKIDFFNETIVTYKKYLDKIDNLPESIKINNSLVAFQMEEYDTELPLYDVSNLLALDLQQQISSAKKILNTYMPNMNVFVSESYSFMHDSIGNNMALLISLNIINYITDIADMTILDEYNQIEPEFIKVLNILKKEITKMEKQMQTIEESYYSEFTDIVLNHQNERPINFERVFKALSMGTKHNQIDCTVEGKNAIMVLAMHIVKEVKKMYDIKALIVSFQINPNISLDRVDEAIERIETNIDKDIEIFAGTSCNYDSDDEKITVNAIAIGNVKYI